MIHRSAIEPCPHCQGTGRVSISPEGRIRNLSSRRLAVLEAVHRFINRTKMSPTFQDIGNDLDRDKVTIYEHVQILKGMGLLTSNAGSRSIRLTTEGLKAIGAAESGAA